MSKPDPNEVCNHCGKPIHPPQQPMLHGTTAVINWHIEQSNKQQDCVWIERHNLRGGAFAHPLTNYICLECNQVLSDWLRGAWAATTQSL